MQTEREPRTGIAPETVVRVLLIGDNEPVRHNAREQLFVDPAIDVVGDVGVSDALSSITRSRPDVAILLFNASGMEEIALCREISSLGERTRLLVLASQDDAETTLLFFKAGAHGFVGQPILPQLMRHSVHDVARGIMIVPPSIAGRVRRLMMNGKTKAHGTGLSTLTSREAEILRAIGDGLRNHEIGKTLGISRKTVETHIRHVLLKLSVNSRTQAVVQAMKNGWL